MTKSSKKRATVPSASGSDAVPVFAAIVARPSNTAPSRTPAADPTASTPHDGIVSAGYRVELSDGYRDLTCRPGTHPDRARTKSFVGYCSSRIVVH